MRKFLLKVGLFSLPFIFLLILYFVLDPFKVLYHYDSFFNEKENGTVFLNSDYVATTNFENHYDDQQYNSFIFGNSRAWFYRIADWQEYIGNEPAYHFDAAGETLYAMHKKVLYLDRKNVNLKNVLIVMDHELLESIEPKITHLGMVSPQLVRYENWFDFHTASLTGFFNVQFMFGYLDYKISGRLKPYMHRNALLETRPFTYNAITNEMSFYHFDQMIEENEYYDDERMKVFYSRNSHKTFSPAGILQPQRQMLEEMAAVLRKHNTSYRIIISPLYNQEYLAREDLDYLETLFGPSNVYDFSGVNEITEDFSSYYEVSHYRPPVARKLMQQVYRNNLHVLSR